MTKMCDGLGCVVLDCGYQYSQLVAFGGMVTIILDRVQLVEASLNIFAFIFFLFTVITS